MFINCTLLLRSNYQYEKCGVWDLAASSGEVAHCNQLRIGRRLQPIRALNQKGMSTGV